MAEPGLKGLRILVVEDEYLLAMDLRRDLQGQGAIVIGPAPSLDKAFDLIESEPRIDVAMLDVNLNGEAVFPVAECLREKGVPFLFATGYDANSIPSDFVDAPCCAKPLSNAKVHAAVAKLAAGQG